MSVLLVENDFIDAEKRLQFKEFNDLRKFILSTSSHQRPPIVTLDSPLYRPYEPKTPEEKLLVFADVCGCLLS